MASANVEIVEIQDDDDDDDITLHINGSTPNNPISIDTETCYVGMPSLRQRRRMRRDNSKIDVDVEFIVVDEEDIEPSGSGSGVKRGFDLNIVDVDDEVEVEIVEGLAPAKKKSKCESSDSRLDRDELHTFKCEICVDDKPVHQLFVIRSCNHHYCSDCVTRYVGSKLDDSIPHVTCPVTDCKGVLDPQECQEILPKQVFDRWGDVLCEALFPASQKVYCPYKNCSGLLLDDCKRGKRVMKKFECLHCKRLFCFQCKSVWHEKMRCEEFQKLNKDGLEAEDIMMMKLAKTKKWQRCPKCKFYVQRNEGCNHMSCRCGHQFCYRCGATWPQCNNGTCR